ncbi:Outer membrane protein beta-barrel domain-containing protein [Corallococcus soli]
MRLLRRMLGPRCAGVAVSCWLGAGPAWSSESEVTARADEAASVRQYVNLRFGASSGSKRLEMCLEISPLEAFSLEGCGTGSEILHHENSPEMAHFRAKYTLTQWKTEVGWLQPRIGLGFAELQMGADDAGFQFGGVGPRGVETAGPEATLGLRGIYPLGSHFDLVGELSFSMAWLKHAPQLIIPQSAFQPALSFTLGAGF